MDELESEIKFQIEYQESILQNVRSSHLIFQALFIAICIAILIFLGTAIISSPFLYDKSKHAHPVIFHLLVFIFVLFVNYVAISHGMALNERYASMIEKRGRVVDFVHHFALLCSMSRIPLVFEHARFEMLNADAGFQFTRSIKILERILDDPHQKYEKFCRYNKGKEALQINEPEFLLIKFVGLHCDIYDTKYGERDEFIRYMNGAEENFLIRAASSARRGHYDEFNALWHVVSGATMFCAIVPVMILYFS